MLAGILLLVLAAVPPPVPPAAGTIAESTRAGPGPPRSTHTPRSILMLFSADRLAPSNVVFDTSFRQALDSEFREPIDCFSEFLDEARLPARHQERTRDFLRAKYGERPPEVVVAFAPPSRNFCLEYCPQLFPDVPIVFAGEAPGAPGGSELGPGITGVRSSADGPATLRLALGLHPRTRQVHLVVGSATPDSVLVATGWSSFREPEFRAAFHRLPVEPLPQLLEKLSQLPENSLVMYVSEFGDGTGNGDPPQELVERMVRVSRAPIYGISDAGVGHGVVGAVATPTEAIGRETADLVVEVLSRQEGAELPAVRTLAATPLFDWRQLQRWGVRRSQLPPGSIVRFKPPSFWRQHLALVTTTGGLILLQTGLILALVLQSRRRRLAEREAQRRRQELAHMTRVATMGELTASLAHEINQPLAAILTNARAAQRLLAAESTDREEIREILADIAADDQRAGEVIRRMRALLRKGESTPMTLDVNDLVTEVVGLVRGEMILQNVSLALELLPGLPRVHGDRIQLQQVLLNLMMNALDAMKETSGGNRKVTVRSSAPDGHTVQVSVEDSGTGLPVDKIEEVFEPFVTTKPHGMGLGLAICRSILQSHGGRIGSANNADRGATFWFTLPAEDVKR